MDATTSHSAHDIGKAIDRFKTELDRNIFTVMDEFAKYDERLIETLRSASQEIFALWKRVGCEAPSVEESNPFGEAPKSNQDQENAARMHKTRAGDGESFASRDTTHERPEEEREGRKREVRIGQDNESVGGNEPHTTPEHVNRIATHMARQELREPAISPHDRDGRSIENVDSETLRTHQIMDISDSDDSSELSDVVTEVFTEVFRSSETQPCRPPAPVQGKQIRDSGTEIGDLGESPNGSPGHSKARNAHLEPDPINDNITLGTKGVQSVSKRTSRAQSSPESRDGSESVEEPLSTSTPSENRRTTRSATRPNGDSPKTSLYGKQDTKAVESSQKSAEKRKQTVERPSRESKLPKISNIETIMSPTKQVKGLSKNLVHWEVLRADVQRSLDPQLDVQLVLSLFYAIGSPFAIFQLRDICSAARRANRSTSAGNVDGLSGTMQFLDRLDTETSLASMQRRYCLVRLAQFRENRRMHYELANPRNKPRVLKHGYQKPRNKTSGTRQSESLALEDTLNEGHPGAAKLTKTEYDAKLKKLQQRLSNARVYCALAEKFGRGILAVIPTGPIVDIFASDVERLRNDALEFLLNSLDQCRGEFLREVGARLSKIDEVLFDKDTASQYLLEYSTDLEDTSFDAPSLLASCTAQLNQAQINESAPPA